WGQYAPKVAADLYDQKEQAFDWHAALTTLSLTVDSYDKLAKLWCPEFAPASGASTESEQILNSTGVSEGGHFCDVERLSIVVTTLRQTRRLLTERNLFSSIEERLYEAMRYLQLLKCDILRDKLVLARKGLEAFELSDLPPATLVYFLLVRRAVLNKL